MEFKGIGMTSSQLLCCEDAGGKEKAWEYMAGEQIGCGWYGAEKYIMF